ncbi:hypothetical protein DUI87_15026 [Hirundo rustica rustica]|uniref:Uncharacterized protein n=1 Tax=Hirundo rustica rustica TaxID=333673 RepID=A0A3M0K6M8_HIRRU|nr:hypothetical protein DUI87_15026 [Hirundo rustica rustica]
MKRKFHATGPKALCSSGVIPERMAQDCVQTGLEYPRLPGKGGFVQRNNPTAPELTAAGINIPNIADSPEQAPLKIPAIAGNLFYKQPKWAAKSWERCKFNLQLANSLLDYLHSLGSKTFAS